MYNHFSPSKLVGYAWSGGGRGVARVDISLDEGKTWQTADIRRDVEQPNGREWGWVLWETDVSIPEAARGTELKIVCKAVDNSYNNQVIWVVQ